MEIQMDGKQYRRDGEAPTSTWGGNWFFKYRDKWHKVINYGIKIQLNQLADIL